WWEAPIGWDADYALRVEPRGRLPHGDLGRRLARCDGVGGSAVRRGRFIGVGGRWDASNLPAQTYPVSPFGVRLPVSGPGGCSTRPPGGYTDPPAGGWVDPPDAHAGHPPGDRLAGEIPSLPIDPPGAGREGRSAPGAGG